MRHRTMPVVLAAGCALAVPLVTPAGQATPPAAPVPGVECRIAPRSQMPWEPDHRLNVVLTGPPPGIVPVATPIRVCNDVADPVLEEGGLPDGPPVDARTLAAVSATIRELAACSNAEPALAGQIEALHTDDYFRRNTEIMEIATLEPPDNPLDVAPDPDDSSRRRWVAAAGWRVAWLGDDVAMPAIERVWWLPDRWVAAIVRAEDVDRVLIVFAADAATGRSLIDEFAQRAVAGTPAAASR